ncbi:endonuclease Q family protein [Fictibacillus aquaticus]|uniref:TIGR00375 family protein n=1 Tax=Fictibacillus aquaticus TaxID=2021314 RepID=A0A235FFP0_9BACL|nr:endonuclease Q family protein [Fictibacillus aquaticus]OYD59774.1 TIGR00375 family protein [Fictibacillus aquaticus]
MKHIFADLHIHIGRTMTGRPVKITGSKTLTLPKILQFAKDIKGISMTGIIDCHVPEVISEIETMIKGGALAELQDGGFGYGDSCLITGSEIEINDENCSGPVHVLVYLPDMVALKKWSSWLQERMKNYHLSSQRIYASGLEVQNKAKELGGLFIPAHVFTPFKSLYGKGVQKSLSEVFDRDKIDGIELGLSADTSMAERIIELQNYPFLTNSDAHSLEKIGREHMELSVQSVSFKELKMALRGEGGRHISANFGLDPLLGKYYESVCAECLAVWDRERSTCLKCGCSKRIKGVSRRIEELSGTVRQSAVRPPYRHQVPLEFIPGIGPRTLDKLRIRFGNDMAVLHSADEEALKEMLSSRASASIIDARKGRLMIKAGGGGAYGRIE